MNLKQHFGNWKRNALWILLAIAVNSLWAKDVWDVFPSVQHMRKYCSHNAVESPYCNFSVIRTLEGHSTASAIAISADGKTLVSGGKDKAIKVWDLQTGHLRKTLQNDSGEIYTLAIAPNGKTVVSGSGDRRVRIWNVTSDQRPRMLAAHSYKVNRVEISSDGKTIISHSDDEIKAWNLATGQLKARFPLSFPRLLDISPDGQTVLIRLSNSELVAWDVATNQQKVLPAFFNSFSARISLDGQTLVSIKEPGKRNFELKVSDLATGTLKAQRRFSREFQPLDIAISRNFIVGSTRKGLAVWNLQTAELEATLDKERMSNLVVSSNGKLLAGITGDPYYRDTQIRVLQRP